MGSRYACWFDFVTATATDEDFLVVLRLLGVNYNDIPTFTRSVDKEDSTNQMRSAASGMQLK